MLRALLFVSSLHPLQCTVARRPRVLRPVCPRAHVEVNVSLERRVSASRRFRRRGDVASARRSLEAVDNLSRREAAEYVVEEACVRAAELVYCGDDATALLRGAEEMLDTQMQANARAPAAIAAALRVTRAGAAKHRKWALGICERAFNMVPIDATELDAVMLALVGACVAAQDVDKAAKFVATMKQRGYEPCERTRANMLHAYAKTGRVNDAKLMANGTSLTPAHMAALAGAYAKAGRHARALDALDDALSVHGAHSCSKCVPLLRAVLQSCVNARDSRGAKHIHSALIAAQATPSANVIKLLLSAAFAGGDANLGEQILFGDDGGVGVRYTKGADDLNRMVAAASRTPALSQRARGREALRLFERAKSVRSPDVNAYNVLVAALARCGALGDARLIVYRDMPRARVGANIVTYNSLLHACVVAARPYVALELWPDIRPHANQVSYNTLINLAAECNARELLDAVLDEMRSVAHVSLDAQAVAALLKHYRRTRDAEGARRVVAMYQRSQRAARAPTCRAPLPLDSVVYVSLLTLLLECRREQEAVTLFGLLVVRNAGGVRAYNAMLQHFGARARDAPRALELLASMKRRRVAPDATSYTIAIRAAAASQRLSLALRLLAEMTDVGLGAADTYAWTATITACGRAARPKLALELLGHMSAETAGAPRPDAATYNAAIYAVGMNARDGWHAALAVYDALSRQQAVSADHVTYSALASVALKHRRDVVETHIVEHVLARLESRLAQLRHLRDAADKDAKRARARSAVARVPARAEIRKLNAKLKRVRWLLRNLRGEASSGGGEQGGADGNHTV